jgi:hypothetical protein
MLGWKRLGLSLLAGLIIVGSSGCSLFTGIRDYIAYNDTCNDFVIGWRNEVWAKQSWHDNKHCFADRPYLKHFGEGYQAGYRDVAAGGNGCPPALPPRCYWAWHYQSPEGQAKVAAWFEGYPHGAATAERDNAGGWQEIQVSHLIETQYSPEFQDGTIFLPEEMIEQMQCNPTDPALLQPTPNLQDSLVPAPQADPAFQPAPNESASAFGLRVGADRWAAANPLERFNGGEQLPPDFMDTRMTRPDSRPDLPPAQSTYYE